MLRPGPSMKSEGLAGPQTAGPSELEGEYQRLQLLVGELLLKNHELRCEVARLRETVDAKPGQEKNRQMPPVRFAISKTIFDWESIS
jgi:hypothetical protein